MSDFADLGRQVLEAVITASLGPAAEQYDVRGIVNAYVERFGFVDLDEVDHVAYWVLVSEHRRL